MGSFQEFKTGANSIACFFGYLVFPLGLGGCFSFTRHLPNQTGLLKITSEYFLD